MTDPREYIPNLKPDSKLSSKERDELANTIFSDIKYFNEYIEWPNGELPNWNIEIRRYFSDRNIPMPAWETSKIAIEICAVYFHWRCSQLQGKIQDAQKS